jgi:hypothetical protein
MQAQSSTTTVAEALTAMEKAYDALERAEFRGADLEYLAACTTAFNEAAAAYDAARARAMEESGEQGQ